MKMVLKLLTLGLMLSQADAGPVWMICQPASVQVAEPDENHAWTCQEHPNRCDPRYYDLSIFERRGAERVNDHSETQDGGSVRSITRVFDDGRFEETVEWRDDATGEFPFREVTQGRCVPRTELE